MITTIKKLHILLLISVLLVCLCGCSAGNLGDNSGDNSSVDNASGIVSSHGQLHVSEESGLLCDESGEQYMLRGLSTHGIGWYSEYTNAGAMQWIKQCGGNVIRVAMYTQANKGYLEDPEGNIDAVYMAVENAIAEDMYVVVDWHILEDGDPTAYTQLAITFFDAIASHYAGEPAVIYEICNEPNGVHWDKISEYAYAIEAVIRQYSPEALILVGTPDYSSKLPSADSPPLYLSNIMYTYHFYAGEHSSFEELETAVDSGVPVFVSEWGIGTDTDGNAALDDGRDFVRFLEKHNISWCGWSLCNKDESYSVLKPECSVFSRWQESDLTDVGIFFKNAMTGAMK